MMGDAGAPPYWLLYFGVDDTGTAAEAVKANGGTVVQDPFSTPYGTMAGVRDPAGASFWLVQVAPDQPQPDRGT